MSFLAPTPPPAPPPPPPPPNPPTMASTAVQAAGAAQRAAAAAASGGLGFGKTIASGLGPEYRGAGTSGEGTAPNTAGKTLFGS